MLYLLYRNAENDRNMAGVHSALVDAEDEPEARQIVAERAPFAIKTAGWAVVPVASDSVLPAGMNPVFFDGDACTMLGRYRGQ